MCVRCKCWQKIYLKRHFINNKATNPVVVAVAAAASLAAVELTAAPAHTVTLLVSPAPSRSWPSPASAEAAAARPGCEAPSPQAAPAGPALRQAAAVLDPALAHEPHPAPERAAALSAVPSPAAGLPSAYTFRKCSSGTCSTACDPSTLSWAGGCGSARSSAAHAAPPS